MAIKIRTDKNAPTGLYDSKFFGEIPLDERLIKSGYFSPTDVFLCALDLAELSRFDGAAVLPKNGMLLFFVDPETAPASAKVVYVDNADAYVCFNEDSDCGYEVEDPVAITFSAGEEGTCCLVKDDKVKDGETCLLRFRTCEFEEVDFLCDVRGSLYFIARTADILRGDFSETQLYFVEKNG